MFFPTRSVALLICAVFVFCSAFEDRIYDEYEYDLSETNTPQYPYRYTPSNSYGATTQRTTSYRYSPRDPYAASTPQTPQRYSHRNPYTATTSQTPYRYTQHDPYAATTPQSPYRYTPSDPYVATTQQSPNMYTPSDPYAASTPQTPYQYPPRNYEQPRTYEQPRSYQPQQTYGNPRSNDPSRSYDQSRSYNLPQPRVQPPTYYPLPSSPSHTNEPDVVTLPNGGGSVRGKELRSAWTGKNFKAFLGLKYGSVGMGALARFQPGQPVPASYEIIDATKEPTPCPSFPDLLKVEKAERDGHNVDDCLTLSIFTPNVHGNKPVMIYVHGEMLFDGSAEEAKPEYLLEKDIVLVAVNYRLAPIGFLSTQTDGMPGNVAIADIELATKWVQENIEAFGGNSDSVTLFGQAGGATLVHALSISDNIKPNFDALILQSGTALNPLFIDEEPIKTARAIATESRCQSKDIWRPYELTPYELTHCLGSMKTSELLSAFVSHCNNNERQGLHSCGGFKLSVGDKLGYLPTHPALMVKGFNMPLVAGMAKDAGAFILIRKYDELVRLNSRNISDYINVILRHTTTPKHYSTWRNWALEYIFSPEDIRNPVLSNLASGLLELTNLILFKAPLLESVKTAYKNYATYLYSFDYRGQYHRFPKKRTHFPYEVDANLSDDNMYLFPYPEEVSRLNNVDRNVAQSMVAMWTNFAINVAPSDKRQWPKMNNEYGPYVRIGSSLELDYHFGDGIPLPDLYAEMRKNQTMKPVSLN